MVRKPLTNQKGIIYSIIIQDFITYFEMQCAAVKTQ